MAFQKEILLTKVEYFVKNSFKSGLSQQMYFHNLEHTLFVVEDVKRISRAENRDDDECFILILAAFMHDIGYTEKYSGHEEASAFIAAAFLRKNGLPKDIIEAVLGCIIATKFPQVPTNEMEMIICDADLYHFAMPKYQGFAERLKAEWENNLNLYLSELEWDKLNLEMLSTHKYFTAYGKNVLQKKKERNVQKLRNRIGLLK